MNNTNADLLISDIKSRSPLIWNISNFVSMDIAANMLLAIGASPAMAHAIEEADAFAGICSAINLSLIHISEPTRPY